jgi:hypothetical protein
MRLTSYAIPVLLVALLTAALPLWAQKAPATEVTTFNARIPLGINAFFVRPARRTLYVMSTARSTLFSGWKQVGTGTDRIVVKPDGSRVRLFPTQLQFRVTATARVGEALEVDRDFLDVSDNLNDFLLRLGFRLKIFHGLDVTTVEPDAIDLIGMPADLPYDERVYRASFTIPPVPIDDRIVLEVLAPDGERFCKFHLEF